MKEVLIMNLTRMGDLIQTTPVIIGLREKHPGVHITLLVNSAFAEICKFIPYIDRLIIFDIKGTIKTFYNDHDLIKGFRQIEDILKEINHVEYDLTINFTHSTDSAVLCSLIRTKEIRGASIDEAGHSIKRHPWIRYFFNVIPGRDYNPFHLCDMHVKVAEVMPCQKGLALHLSEEINVWVRTVLAEHGIRDSDLLIGLQLGASAEDKRWPAASFARLADRLAETFGAKIILTGSSSERELGNEFESITKIRPLNFIEKTNLDELAGLLKRCDLFISNDTGPLHIATAVGTTTINISLASVHFRETGPYGDGHYVIAPDVPCYPCGFNTDCKRPICKEVINTDNLFDLVDKVIREKDFSSIDNSALWRDVQVYRSFFENDGLIDYRPLIKKRLNKEVLFSYIYRKSCLKILDKEDVNDLNDGFRYFAEKLHLFYDLSSLNTKNYLEDEFDAMLRLRGLAEIGLAKLTLIALEAGKPVPDTAWIKETWADVPVIEKEIENIGYTHPPLKPLFILFRYGQEGLEGRDLAAMSEETRMLYSDLKKHISLMIQCIDSRAVNRA
ncbi:MAG: glycosyltransferase family 9 protein [Nitrospirae bacterium]|nr:glycosyltransferase family 9 protein [Nitrospirota bacterium]